MKKGDFHIPAVHIANGWQALTWLNLENLHLKKNNDYDKAIFDSQKTITAVDCFYQIIN